jgi:predicted Zn-dependent protease
LSGLFVYLKLHVDDYRSGVEELEKIGSEQNMAFNNLKVDILIDQKQHEDAIVLLQKLIAKDKGNIINQLKLAQLYCNFCKHDYQHCEDAIWQLNAIIASDSTNVTAKKMLENLNDFLEVKL